MTEPIAATVRPAPSEPEFRAIYEAWYRAIAEHDREWFERTLADDFRYIHFEGGVWDKQQLIDVDMSVDATEVTWHEIDVTELTPGIAAVVGRYTAWDAISDEHVTDSMRATLGDGLTLRWNALWRHEDGRWQVFLHHGTMIVSDPV
jgi:hypothetical protein